MKFNKSKINAAVAGGITAILPALTTVLAAPRPNEEGFKREIEVWTEPFTNIALWAIPIITGLVCLVHGISWMIKDEEEKEQKPIKKTLKKVIMWGLILMLVPTILKLLGM